jgi:Na+-transporting NADH:ubiquinone oxidoreductase subunit NqrA
MSDTIKLKRGLDIKLQGEADKVFIPLRTRKFAVKPTDFVGLRYAKLLVKEGDEVKVGTQLCYDKYRENIRFTSPVSGKVVGIKRGAKRILEEIQIESDEKGDAIDFGAADPNKLSAEEIKQKLLKSGGNITMVVNNLEDRDLVTRERLESDRRFVSVDLTEKGRALIEEVLPGHVDKIVDIFGVLSDEEQVELARLSKRVGLNLAGQTGEEGS